MNKLTAQMQLQPAWRLDERCRTFALLAALRDRVLVVDGAMGTMLHRTNVSDDDYEGKENCIEILNATRPDVVGEIHAAYCEAGADIIETNTLGSMPMVLAEFGVAERGRELSRKAAEIARGVARDYSAGDKPRWVAGSVGPTTKMPSLSHVSFDRQLSSYREQIRGLLEGGVDAVMIETQFDLLNLKCAVIAARCSMHDVGREVPICAHVTIESTGTMLTGSDIGVALAVMESMEVDVVGVNCATGPDMMQEHVRYLGEHAAGFVSVMPNAGIPRNVDGKAEFDLEPTSLADHLEKFVEQYGVNMVGGCCGTTPEHIRAVAQRLAGRAPRLERTPLPDQASSLFTTVALTQAPPPLIIGERTNATGSKRFRELLLRNDWDGMVEMAQEAAAEGTHMLDVSTACSARDELRDMTEILKRLATQVSVPLLIDTTQPDVMEAGLKLIGGRAILNSVNLEDGEQKANRIFELARQYGSGVIGLTIDEEGMAKTAERKVAIARRLYEMATKRHGIPPGALLIDPLTFPVTSGDEETRAAAAETLSAVKRIKELLGVRVILGLSNVSFGLQPRARQVLNSVFLFEALERGLDAAILNAGKILPLAGLAADVVTLARDLLFDQRREGYDPLLAFVERFRSLSVASDPAQTAAVLPIEERVRKAVIDGKKRGIEELLSQALQKHPPLEIMNDLLLDAMRTVGELFGSGKMQLPFVLQAAETTKAAVVYLSRFMDHAQAADKGVVILATVKGDVHDIGKNLVDIILSNNGYRVVDLGIKVPVERMIEAAEDSKADAIGMSGLLVKSTAVMRENLELMAERGYTIPVICGGAALNRDHVEGILSHAYRTGEVYFGRDAFTGLHLMEELCGHQQERKLTGPHHRRLARRGGHKRHAPLPDSADEYVASDVEQAKTLPFPPFWGARIVEGSEILLADVFAYINKHALFRHQWQYRRGRRNETEYRQFVAEYVEPKFRRWCERVTEAKMLSPAAVYGYFPCNALGNEVIIYYPDEAKLAEEWLRIRFPRQASGRRLCLADFFRPLESGERDVIAVQLVTMGAAATHCAHELLAADRYDDYLHLHGFGVEATEALAELWHRRVRLELNIAAQDGATVDQLLHHEYQGSRYSFGYPACPRLEDQRHVFTLLRPERIGITLTDEYELVPEQSTSAIICHHPNAVYFNA